MDGDENVIFINYGTPHDCDDCDDCYNCKYCSESIEVNGKAEE